MVNSKEVGLMRNSVKAMVQNGSEFLYLKLEK
jgi:hypothetical protein